MKKLYRSLKLKLLQLSNKLYQVTHKSKFKHHIAIISCRKWQNKIKEDLMLQKYLLHNNINTEIIAWEDTLPTGELAIIRSVWGYQNNIERFTKYLETINNNEIKLLNDYSILKDNLSKNHQLEILEKYEIPHISTEIVYDFEKLEKLINNHHTQVIKPIISASGDNTYVINSAKKNSLTIAEVKGKYQHLINKGLMIQPFIDEIKDGEISLIFINNQLTHSVIRFPGIFTEKISVEYNDLKNIDDNLQMLIKNVQKIKEYQNHTYMRIDVVKIDNQYQIMEIELLEPQLFFEWIPDLNQRKKTYQILINVIINKLKNKNS